MSKGKDRIVVQDALSFANTAAKLVATMKIIHLTPAQITEYANTKPFIQAKEVKGITSMHIMSVHGCCTKLWRNAAFYKSEEPAIIQNEKMSLLIAPLIGQDEDVTFSIESAQPPTNVNDLNDKDKELAELPLHSAKNGLWVKVIYEEEIFISKITNICSKNGCEVRCLRFPYLVGGTGSEFERESERCYYTKVYSTNVIPKATQVGRKFLWTYTSE